VNDPFVTALTYIVKPASGSALSPARNSLSLRIPSQASLPTAFAPSGREVLQCKNDLFQVGLGDPGHIGRHSVPPVARSGTTPAQNVHDDSAGIRTLNRE